MNDASNRCLAECGFDLLNAHSLRAPLAGYAIYIWHCRRDGLYSLYSSGVQNENFLRGV